jgi:hypothetical protein
MKKWKRLVLVNLGALGGAVAALFIVPESTPVWIWGLVSLVFLVALNIAALKRKGSAEGRTVPSKSGNKVIILLGLALLVLDLVLSRCRR